MATITSIGIGNMGAALASAYLKSGSLSQLIIWNRTADRPQVKSLVEQGAHFEPSLPAAIARSNTILICLLDYPSVNAIFDAISPGSLAGKTVINLTNGTPRQAREAEKRFKGALGAAAYFDGGIMSPPQQIATPEASIILSGEDETAFNAAGGPAELLKPLAAVHYVAGDVGAASLRDISALASMYGMFAGAFIGISLLQKQKQPQQQQGSGKALTVPGTNAVIVPVLRELVPYVSLLAEHVDKEDWMNDLGNRLDMQAAVLHNILQTCEEEGVDGEALKSLSRVVDRAVADGFGPGGLTAVNRYMFK